METASDNNLTPQWCPSDPFKTSSVAPSVAISATSWDAPVGVPKVPSGEAGASELNQTAQNELSKQMEKASISSDNRHLNGPHSSERGSSPHPVSDEQQQPEQLTLEDVWPKFKEADLTRDLDDVKPALALLCQVYRGKSWTDIEKKLREENCNTHLVATMDRVSFGYTLVNLKGEPNQEFRVIPSFIKPGSIKRGRMAVGMASSYEENLSRLEHAGVVRPSGVPRCHNCKEEGHVVNDCPEEKREPEKSEFFGKCYNCGSEEHRTRTCKEPRRVLVCRNCNQEGHMAKTCSEPPAPIVCNRCNEEGHYGRDCDQPRSNVTCYRCSKIGHITKECPEPRVEMTCLRCGNPDHAVRDCPQPRTDVTCNRCSQFGHMARDCPEPRTDVTCNRCGQFGHMVRDCPQPRTDITCNRCGQPGHMGRDCGQSRQMSCYKCNEVGHKAFECPNEEYANGGGGGGDRRPPRPDRFGFSQGF